MYKIIHSQLYFRIILSILAIRLSTILHIRGESSRECNYFKNNSESIRTACFADSNLASGGKNRIQNREFHISSKFDFGEKERKLRLFVVSAANAKRARTKGAEWRTTRELTAQSGRTISGPTHTHHFNYFASFHAIVPAIGVHREKCFLLGRAAR